ncbi:hypothetical protein M0811_05972 [Anaeramoeba ignava]|uniref:PPM-type phosphatase domain-containing protein n=1 Tax=Anaeramoeba ignava TaxID=1746090 RepID=A0A9Q0LRZ6_ANAIG|nr:hypothetical protein M0811_05972 [Anaeramoeba ignava]
MGNCCASPKNPIEDVAFIGMSLEKVPPLIGLCYQLNSLDLTGNHIQKLPSSLVKQETIRSFIWKSNHLKKVPQNLYEMKNLQFLDLSCNHIYQISDRIQKLTSLTELDLHENLIETFPDLSFGYLQSLIKLNASRNCIRSIPECVQNLNSLRELDLNGNSLPVLPQHFSSLTNLQMLNLSNNVIKNLEMNNGLQGLVSLHRFDLSYNLVEKIPETIKYLKNLRILIADFNRISLIHDAFGNLSKITQTTFENNKLKDLPNSFGKLSGSLLDLNLRSNKFKEIPGVLQQLRELQVLIMSRNKISSFTLQLTKLIDLDLSDNRIERFEDNAFMHLHSISKLNLAKNRISSLPESVSTMRNLSMLNLSSNNLQKLPQNIGNLVNLKELDLSENKLQSLPDEIGQLIFVYKLMLNGNQLKSLPQTFSHMKNLNVLNLSKNLFECVPPVLFSFSKLQKLTMSDCKLRIFPSNMILLMTLKELNLSANNIRLLSPSIGMMRSLSELNLSNNKIAEIPDSFFDLGNSPKASLCKIDFSGNQLGEFSELWFRFTNLQELDLSHNRIQKFPIDGFEKFSSIESLKLSHNRCENIDISSARRLTKLEFLHLEGNILSDSFQKILNKISSKNPHHQKNTRSHKEKNERLFIRCSLQRSRSFSNNHSLGDSGNMGINSNISINSSVNSNMNNSVTNNIPNGVNNPLNRSQTPLDFPVAKEILVDPYKPNWFARKIHWKSARFTVGYSETKGKRGSMEDTIDIRGRFGNWPNVDFFALYDGHKGRFTADFLAFVFSGMLESKLKKLFPQLKKTQSQSSNYFAQEDPNKSQEPQEQHQIHNSAKDFSPMKNMSFTNEPTNRLITENLTENDTFELESQDESQSLHANNNNSTTTPNKNTSNFGPKAQAPTLNRKLSLQDEEKLIQIKQTFHDLFLQVNKKLEKTKTESGATAVISLIVDNKCFIVNVGDSRAVLSRQRRAFRVSFDHKPTVPSEQQRIRNLGGIVSRAGRVNGTIAISRAIGDSAFQPFVSCEPYVFCFEIENDDRFLILACDGVWDVLSDQETVDIANSIKDPYLSALSIRNAAFSKGSTDNISVIVVDLKPNRTQKFFKKNSSFFLQSEINEKNLAQIEFEADQKNTNSLHLFNQKLIQSSHQMTFNHHENNSSLSFANFPKRNFWDQNPMQIDDKDDLDIDIDLDSNEDSNENPNENSNENTNENSNENPNENPNQNPNQNIKYINNNLYIDLKSPKENNPKIRNNFDKNQIVKKDERNENSIN